MIFQSSSTDQQGVYHSNKYALHNQFCFASITFNKKPFLLLVHKERQEKAYSHPSSFHLQHHWMLYRQKRFQQYTFYSLCKIHTCSIVSFLCIIFCPIILGLMACSYLDQKTLEIYRFMLDTYFEIFAGKWPKTTKQSWMLIKIHI